MKDLSIEEFCDKHDACSDGREWAIKNCRDMAHAWETLKPEWLVWVATRDGVLDDKTLRMFAVWCARQVQHLMKDQRSVAAIDVAERFAHGNATVEELAAARAAARDAARDAAWDAARAAARDAAWDSAWDSARPSASDAARYAAWDAASDAARYAAWDAASDAARYAAWDAAWDAASDAAWAAAMAAVRDAAMESQADWLRKNAKPNFK